MCDRDLRCVVFGLFENQGAHGADFHAFSALDASGFGEGFVLVSRDDSFETASCKTYRSNIQLLLTYPNAFATENTFIWIISKDRTTFIKWELPIQPPESGCLYFNTEVFSNLQEFTRTAF